MGFWWDRSGKFDVLRRLMIGKNEKGCFCNGKKQKRKSGEKIDFGGE
jgi:hypothetical protein